MSEIQAYIRVAAGMRAEHLYVRQFPSVSPINLYLAIQYHEPKQGTIRAESDASYIACIDRNGSEW